MSKRQTRPHRRDRRGPAAPDRLRLHSAALLAALLTCPIPVEPVRAAEGPPTSRTWLVVTGSRVNVRRAPDLGARKVALYVRGTRLENLQRKDAWIRVRHPKTSKTGWMHGDYLKEAPPPRRLPGGAAPRSSAPPAAKVAALPAPKTDPKRRPAHLVVYGDSFATDLFHGLKWAANRNRPFTVKRRTRGATGLVRDDAYDWYAHLGRILAADRPEIAVVAMGGNDRQGFRTPKGSIKRFGERWRRLYRQRVDRFMTRLKAHAGSVVWVGLPVVRSKRMSTDYRVLNDIYRAAAGEQGIRFVDIWPHFQSASGGYAAFGKGVAGKRRRLRAGDGIHLSGHGARKLGLAVARVIGSEIEKRALAAR